MGIWHFCTFFQRFFRPCFRTDPLCLAPPRQGGRKINIRKHTCLLLPNKLFAFGKKFLFFCQMFCFLLPSGSFSLCAPVCLRLARNLFAGARIAFPKHFTGASQGSAAGRPKDLILRKQHVSLCQRNCLCLANRSFLFAKRFVSFCQVVRFFLRLGSLAFAA